MTHRPMDLAEFHQRAGSGAVPNATVRLALAGEPLASMTERAVTFIFSDNSVDRYGDTIDARGWVLDKFLANPVALFGHDSGAVEHVIGKARNVRIEGQRLVGEIEFMEAAINPTAECVFQMVKGGYLNAVSVGFQPIEWQMTKDKSRPGGIDFSRQELLEISIVPIPANANALAQARAAGIDVDRLALRSAAKASAPKVKSLWHVAWLADLLADLGMLEDCVEWEAEFEADGSQVPQALSDALKALGQILIDMTAEEVAELLAADDDPAPSPVVEMSMKAGRLRVLRSLVKADFGILHGVAEVLEMKREPGSFVDRLAIRDRLTRAGKVISSDNENRLRDAHGHMSQACEIVMGVLDACQPEDPEDKGAQVASRADAERAMRARRAAALREKIALTSH